MNVYTNTRYHQHYLEFDVYSRREPRNFIYSVLLMYLFPYEMDLCSGRFSRFARSPLTHHAMISKDISGPELQKLMGEMVNWIAEYTIGQWSLDVEMLHVGYCALDFSFDDPGNSVMFALMWK